MAPAGVLLLTVFIYGSRHESLLAPRRNQRRMAVAVLLGLRLGRALNLGGVLLLLAALLRFG